MLDSGFRLADQLAFELALPFGQDSYVDYVMSEANVAHAVRGGTDEQQLRAWCERSLAAVFGGREQEVVFAGYVAFLAPS